MKHLVSVIIPIYNVEPYLKDMLESVINQKYNNLEILLINDGSTDESGEICNYYKSIDDRICVFHKINEGPSEARNFGLKKSKGDFIIFLDSDDIAYPEMISSMLNAIIQTNAEMCICNVKRIYGDKVKTQCKENLPSEIDFTTEDKNNYVYQNIIREDRHKFSIWNRLFKAETIRKYNIEFVSYKDVASEDMLFNLSVLPFVSKIVWIQTPLYDHFIRQGTLTTSPKPNITSRVINQSNLYHEFLLQWGKKTEFDKVFPYVLLKTYIMAVDYEIVHNKSSFKTFIEKHSDFLSSNLYRDSFKEILLNRNFNIAKRDLIAIKLFDKKHFSISSILFFVIKKSIYTLGKLKYKLLN
ncbi:Putative glycosyltransferase EpsH [Bacillus sp. THAF10]|uniref:glycosyltransferase family 2 protein n=1 Tax=Bacillus sp. THAF10 TaxID=2587848 RepID=UPI001269507D|nr:glycosyltransferase family 2 protein [Bacillus sp. THAF10]QFT90853.1 Putative glycosyltransferase EpsH [Bacillus sp. THAF10]